MQYKEYNFDTLVGLTHNYAGLSYGNIASKKNAAMKSNPKEAALQGLEKMYQLHKRGIGQGVFPPQLRPNLSILKNLGFTGDDAQLLESAFKQSVHLFSAICSSSSMWAANAATIGHSLDSTDKKLHITPANLLNKFHRSIESKTTSKILKAIFSNTDYFCIHDKLPMQQAYSDEGAANHTRLACSHNVKGVNIFCFGMNYFETDQPRSIKFPARQTLEASQAIARLHRFAPEDVIFIQQHPDIIDAGAFHNDVVAVGNENTLLYFEGSYINEDDFIAKLRSRLTDSNLEIIKVLKSDLDVSTVINTYLFNSQLITKNDGSKMLVAPIECKENNLVRQYLDDLISQNNSINEVIYFNLRESMLNGGGPACLRLRVTLNSDELNAVNQSCLMSNDLYNKLKKWITKHYRSELTFDCLKDIQLYKENIIALDELANILKIKNIYDFQQDR